eukprot:EG_transcript_8624
MKMMKNDGKMMKMMKNDGKMMKMMKNDGKMMKMMKNDGKIEAVSHHSPPVISARIGDPHLRTPPQPWQTLTATKGAAKEHTGRGGSQRSAVLGESDPSPPAEAGEAAAESGPPLGGVE